MRNQKFIGFILLLFMSSPLAFAQIKRDYYKESLWHPRIIPTYEEIISGTFFPKSPDVHITYKDLGIDKSKISKIPAPGIHPRVLMNPEDIETIRKKVAMGEDAPISFKCMWKRVKDSRSPFYALVAKDEKLGRMYADLLVEKIQNLDKKIDLMNAQPDHENLWAVERSIIAQGLPDPPTEIWDLLDYDYIAPWMNSKEKEMARKVIARITEKRYSNFMMYPDHFLINNHQGFGLEYVRLMLLIEGEEGFNKPLFERAVQKTKSILDWYLDDQGMCYETIKGWLNTSAIMAVALRHPELLRHDHLWAKMNFFLAAMWYDEDGHWKIRDEMRASAFHPIWMMHYYYPHNPKLDFLYQASLNTNEILVNPDAKWTYPVGICNELLLLFAEDCSLDKSGNKYDWNNQAQIDALGLSTTWKDDVRGYVYWRNSWNKGDMQASFQCKQDFFYGGHEATEDNRIIMRKYGIEWIKDYDMLATKATFLQNMMTIDGKGCKWPPAPCTFLGTEESNDAITTVGDGRMGYSYTKSMQVHPFAYPSSEVPYYAAFAIKNWDLTRDIQIPFHPNTVKFNDGYAHTDYGPWSGETRFVEGYKEWNMMKSFFRTVHIGKGKYPYLLVMDDANKDSQKHLYEWNISLPADIDLVESAIQDVQFQNTDPSPIRMSDIIVGKEGFSKDPKSGKPILKKGDPLCLIRVLWRNTDYGFPIPRFEKIQVNNLPSMKYSHIVVPAMSISPEFRILIYPYRYGDPMPQTVWNDDRTQLSVKIGDVTDLFKFDYTDGGRIVYEMDRNGKQSIRSNACPPRPLLTVRGKTFDPYSLRDTRKEGMIPSYIFVNNEKVILNTQNNQNTVYYTLDGSLPTEKSNKYTHPIEIEKDCVLKARCWNDSWSQGSKWSELVQANFVADAFTESINSKNEKNGVLLRVYEINTKLYNDKGFFDSKRIMMPNLNTYKPVQTGILTQFTIPTTTPKSPVKEQVKAFYRYTANWYAPKDGIYQFNVKSCGPVTLDIANKKVIEEIGVFHQQLATRIGDVALAKGWHPVELIICDPLYWNVNTLGNMPFEINYQLNNGTIQNIDPSSLSIEALKMNKVENFDHILSLKAISQLPIIEPGFCQYTYNRMDKRRSPDYLDIDKLDPIDMNYVSKIGKQESSNTVLVYNGYFYVGEDGEYIFNAPQYDGGAGSLGSRQAACQNQLRVDNQVIVQRGVIGRHPNRKVFLYKGWHSVSIRVGISGNDFTIESPDGQVRHLDGYLISRDAKHPAFTYPAPKSLGIIDFKNWKGQKGDFTIKGDYEVWLSPKVKMQKEKLGNILHAPDVSTMLAAAVDVNVSKGASRAPIKVYHLKFVQNQMTIGIRFKTNQLNGSIVGKKGYNAFGKGYRTISVEMRNGVLYANPNRLSGGKIQANKWYTLFIAASDKNISLYLDGQLVSTGLGSDEIITDALDFFLDHEADVSKIEIFDKALTEKDIQQRSNNF